MEPRLRSITSPTEVVTRVALIGEHVASVIEDDVEDDVEPLRVGGIDQGAQLVVRLGGVVREPRLRAEEIVDPVSVVGVPEGEVLEHGAEPGRAGAEPLDVPQLLPHAGELPALESGEYRVIERWV